MRKPTREESAHDPQTVAKVRVAYDDGETHWGFVSHNPAAGGEQSSAGKSGQGTADTIADHAIYLLQEMEATVTASDPEKPLMLGERTVVAADKTARQTTPGDSQDNHTVAGSGRPREPDTGSDNSTIETAEGAYKPAADGLEWAELSVAQRDAATDFLWESL